MKRRAIDIDTLWRIQRIGSLALAPDGRRAVCSVQSYSMADNRGSARLWLLHTDGSAAPRPLTTCGEKDAQPAWSPRGDRIAFIARREQQGEKDKTPQLYVIAADGGEARRASRFTPGVESFKWLPDGRRIVFAAWTWPDAQGASAQATRQREFSARKDTGYATGSAYYRYWDRNLPQGRVLHLWLLDVASGRATDLFQGTRGTEDTRYELPRHDGGHADYDVAPDGRRIAFVHDPSPEPLLGNRLALAEIDLQRRRITTLLDDPDWDLAAPRYSPAGDRIALTAANTGRHHNALPEPAMLLPDGRWTLLAPGWDHAVNAPLVWGRDGQRLHFTAEERGRCPLWRLDAGQTVPRVVHAGGWVQAFDVAGDTTVVSADTAHHPARVLALRGSEAPRRIEHLNDELLAKLRLGEVREVDLCGAQGEPVQMWLTLPPGFDASRQHPVTHVIHGGPFAAAGDTFSYRWNAHLLAAAGHVVAQVNYHGSSGFGHAFRHSLVGRQGELELQDIEAASDWLLAQPWADAKRLQATGGSYGGFLVAWMNGHVAPGRYRAHVCHAGVFDRVATFSADSYPERPKDLQARYWDNLPRVLAQSPHAAAAAMRTPTLVIHGAQDFRVPDCNGLAYYNTLKALRVKARLLWFPDENHWVLKPRNSRQWYAEVAAWLK